jgi:hypothetical protein
MWHFVVIYMNTNKDFWLCLAYLFLEWQMFHTKVLEESKRNILGSINIFF